MEFPSRAICSSTSRRVGTCTSASAWRTRFSTLFMYGREEGRHSRAAQTAEAELRRGLEQLANAGLLRIAVDEAMAADDGHGDWLRYPAH